MAHETGLHDRIERVDTLPWDPQTEIGASNPVGKVPALITEDGTAIYDSSVIVDYLDRQHDGQRLLQDEDPARTDVLRRMALADGAMEAIILVFSEMTRRPENLQWDYWIDRQQTKVHRSLDAMNADPANATTDSFDLGHIATAVCVGWIEFRGEMLGVDWRTGRGVVRRNQPARVHAFDRARCALISVALQSDRLTQIVAAIGHITLAGNESGVFAGQIHRQAGYFF